jgi:hypothetical protein
MNVVSMQYVRDLYAAKNPDGHWFDKRTLEFFDSTLPARGERIGDWIYFVTREKTGFTSSNHAFSVRRFNEVTGDIETVGEFLAYATKEDAKAAIRDIRINARQEA